MMSPATGRGLVLGVVIGIISGMIGTGAGHFYSRSDLLPRMSKKTAQGTSVATLLPIGIFAFWSYYKAGHVDLKFASPSVIRFSARYFLCAHFGY